MRVVRLLKKKIDQFQRKRIERLVTEHVDCKIAALDYYAEQCGIKDWPSRLDLQKLRLANPFDVELIRQIFGNNSTFIINCIEGDDEFKHGFYRTIEHDPRPSLTIRRAVRRQFAERVEKRRSIQSEVAAA